MLRNPNRAARKGPAKPHEHHSGRNPWGVLYFSPRGPPRGRQNETAAQTKAEAAARRAMYRRSSCCWLACLSQTGVRDVMRSGLEILALVEISYPVKILFIRPSCSPSRISLHPSDLDPLAGAEVVFRDRLTRPCSSCSGRTSRVGCLRKAEL